MKYYYYLSLFAMYSIHLLISQLHYIIPLKYQIRYPDINLYLIVEYSTIQYIIVWLYLYKMKHKVITRKVKEKVT